MRKNRPLTRKTDVREPKRRFIIYTEGKNTEPDYFRAIKSQLLGALVEIEIIAPAGTPFTIAEKARAHAARRAPRGIARSSFEERDEIWAVFDRDEHPRVSEALELCRIAKVGVAFSDPCFEVWLILHHIDFDRPGSRHQVQAKLREFCVDYDPNCRKTTNCAALIPLLLEAEVRAERQYQNRINEGNPPSPPFTTVYKLTRRMRDAHKAFHGQ